MPAIKPARVDTALLQSFQRAVEGAGDGRVSAKDIKELIVPRFADAGRLTETEKATLAWAVEEFKLTPAAKQLLSDELTALVGTPVFQWQRELKGPMAVRLGDVLTQKELDQKAVLAYQQNTVAFSSEWGDALFNHPESGNSGTHVFALEGNDAERYLKFLAAVNDQPELLDKFSTSTHAIYSVYESDDEEHYGGIIVDKKTGEALAIDDFNIVDVTYVLDRAKFESVFGEVRDDNGRRVSDDDWEDASYNLDIGGMLGRDGRDLPLPNFSPAQEARRNGPLNDAAMELREGFKASPDRTAGWNYGTMARTDDLMGRIATLADEVQSADWRDRERSGEPATVVEPFRPFDDAARAAVIKTMQAVNPDLGADKMEAFLDAMGGEGDLRFARLDCPMTIKGFGADAAAVDFTAQAVVVVNEKEGDWFALYDRPKMQGD